MCRKKQLTVEGQLAGWATGGSSLPAAPSGVLSECEAAGA